VLPRHAGTNASCLVQPGPEHVFDVAAAARVREPALDAAVGDDEQRRHLVDAEALDEVGALVDVDLVEDEGAVVLPPLEDLRDEALDAPAPSGELRVEEHEPWSRRSALPNGCGKLGHTPLQSTIEPGGSVQAAVHRSCTRRSHVVNRR